MTKKGDFVPKKGHFLDPKKGTKRAKIDFSLKLHFLHILAKFKQKIAKKSKNMAKNCVFGPKKGHFGSKKGTKSAKIDFLLKLHFLHFLAKFKQKIAKK